MVLFALVIPAFRFEKVEATPQGSLLLMKPIYLLSSNSTIAGYKTVSFTKPTSTTVKNVSIYGQGSLLIGQWISSAFAFSSPLTIEATYLWLFAIYANTSSQAFLYGEFYLYRSGSESLLFQSMNSGNVNYGNVSLQIWQDRTKQNITFISGDRLIFKLYFDASLGLHRFAYDCARYPSYIQEPAQTRYLRKATQTINGLTAQKLTTSIGDDTYGAYTISNAGRTSCQWGIRVFKRSSAGVNTEITSGSQVAIVVRNSTGGVSAQSNTWSCPATSLVSTDSIVIIWYGKFNGIAWQWMVNSTTEQLNSQNLNASTWTVTYYTLFNTDTQFCKLYYDGLEDSLDIYWTRISGFTWYNLDLQAPYYYNPVIETTLASANTQAYCNWTETGAIKSYLDYVRYGHNNTGSFVWSSWLWFGIAQTTQNYTITWNNNNTVGNVIAFQWQANDTSGNLNNTMPYQYYTITSSKSWHSIELFTFDLLTRKWLPIESFLFDFLTRSWLSVSDWSFDLLTRNWSDIASWNLDLLTRSWSEVVIFKLDLLARSWNSVSSWSFDLLTSSWHSIANWLLHFNIFEVDKFYHSAPNAFWRLTDVFPQDTVLRSGVGQAFNATIESNLLYSKFYMMIEKGNPQGFLISRLYSGNLTSRIYGINQTPADLLATSEPLPFTSLSNVSLKWITFSFNSTNQYSMIFNTTYCIDVEVYNATLIDDSNSLYVASRMIGTHSGNLFSHQSGYWYYSKNTPTYDCLFYVLGYTPVSLADYSFYLIPILFLAILAGSVIILGVSRKN